MININVIGLDETMKKLSDFSEESRKQFGGILQKAAYQFVANAKRDAPKNFGVLTNQITAEQKGPLTWEVISGSAYSSYMEFGTKSRVSIPPEFTEYAGQFNTSGPKSGAGFYDNILAWVKKKGIAAVRTKSGGKSRTVDAQIAQEQAAFAIYLSIIRHGVKPHPYFFMQAPLIDKQLQTDAQQLANDFKL